MVERQYEYQLKAGRVQTRAILSGVGGLWFFYLALTNDRGLILYIIPLSQHAATIFYWIFGSLAVLFSVTDTMNVARRGNLRQRIAFTKEGLMVPRSSWSNEEELGTINPSLVNAIR